MARFLLVLPAIPLGYVMGSSLMVALVSAECTNGGSDLDTCVLLMVGGMLLGGLPVFPVLTVVVAILVAARRWFAYWMLLWATAGIIMGSIIGFVTNDICATVCSRSNIPYVFTFAGFGLGLVAGKLSFGRWRLRGFFSA